MESVKKSNLTNNAFREQDNDRMEQWLTFTYRLRSFLPRPSRAISFAVVVMMFSTMAFATQASTPKDKKIYEVKKFYEKIQLAITSDPKKEVSIHLKHASNRAEEMKKLVKESEVDTQDQSVTEAIKQVVVSLTTNIKDAQDTLVAIKEVGKEGDDSGVVAKLASAVTGGSQDALNTLKTAEQVDNTALIKAVKNATEAVEAVETTSLDILVKEVIEVVATSTTPVVASTTVGEVKVDENKISEEELKKLINNKIERVDKQIEATKTKLTDSVATGDLSSITIPTIAQEKVITDLTKAPDVAKETLNEAKDALANGSVIDALAKVNETKVLVNKSAEAIDLAGVNNLATEAAKLVTPTTTPTVTPKPTTEEKQVLKSSAQESIIDGKTATPTEVMEGITDEFGQKIGNISEERGL